MNTMMNQFPWPRPRRCWPAGCWPRPARPAVIGASAAAGSALGQAEQRRQQASLSNVTLHVGDQAGTGAQALLTAAGLIGKLPFKVDWSDFTSGPPMLQAMGSGRSTSGRSATRRPSSPPPAARRSPWSAPPGNPQGTALLVPKGSPIHSVAQLRGKKIAVAEGSSSNYHLVAVLKKAGLTSKDVTIVNLQPAQALAAFASGQVDAWDVWTPIRGAGRGQHGARILVNGAPIGNTYSFEVASRTALADPAKAAAIRDYLKLIAQAHAWANTHQSVWASSGPRPPGCRSASWPRRPTTTPRRPCPSRRRDRHRAGGRQRVHRGGPDPRPRGLRQLRRDHVQQHRREFLMSLVFHWFLPTSGDGRAIVGRGHSVPLARSRSPARRRRGRATTGRRRRGRPTSTTWPRWPGRPSSSASPAVLTPTGTWCEDAWLVTAALIRETQRLKFLVAFRPGLISPTLAAQMAATYQRISRGRLLLNVVTGGEAAEQRRFGDHLSHDERYARTGEFLDVVRGAWSGAPYDFGGSTTRSAGPP